MHITQILQSATLCKKGQQNEVACNRLQTSISSAWWKFTIHCIQCVFCCVS